MHSAPSIVNAAQLSEPIHEKTDSRPGCAYHFRQHPLIDLADYSLGHDFLAEMKQAPNPG